MQTFAQIQNFYKIIYTAIQNVIKLDETLQSSTKLHKTVQDSRKKLYTTLQICTHIYKNLQKKLHKLNSLQNFTKLTKLNKDTAHKTFVFKQNVYKPLHNFTHLFTISQKYNNFTKL